jgi:hypothetical protein
MLQNYGLAHVLDEQTRKPGWLSPRTRKPLRAIRWARALQVDDLDGKKFLIGYLQKNLSVCEMEMDSWHSVTWIILHNRKNDIIFITFLSLTAVRIRYQSRIVMRVRIGSGIVLMITVILSMSTVCILELITDSHWWALTSTPCPSDTEDSSKNDLC